MKKMMIIAVVGLMTACLQAASVNWLAESAINSNNGGNAVSGSGVYYIFALGGSAQTFGNGGFDISTLALTVLGGGTTFTADANFAIDGSGGSYWDPAEISVVFTNVGGTADTASTSIINQWWAVVTVDAATTGWYGVDVFQVSGQNALSTPFEQYPSGFDVGQYTTVPEPTSMALLALGVAAVGLRRKFRK